jgi:hypothetical protein
VANHYGLLVIYDNGDKYLGDYKDDKKHGKGVFTYSDGSKHECDYKDGKRHGKGIYTDHDGTKYEGNKLIVRQDKLYLFEINLPAN